MASSRQEDATRGTEKPGSLVASRDEASCQDREPKETSKPSRRLQGLDAKVHIPSASGRGGIISLDFSFYRTALRLYRLNPLRRYRWFCKESDLSGLQNLWYFVEASDHPLYHRRAHARRSPRHSARSRESGSQTHDGTIPSRIWSRGHAPSSESSSSGSGADGKGRCGSADQRGEGPLPRPSH